MLRAGMNAISKAVLANVRVPVTAAEHARAFAPAVALQGIRLYGAEGTYLDKGEVTERVLGVVKNFQKVDPAKVSAESAFSKDLGLDSLDTVEVVMAFEEEFAIEIPDAEADKITSCADAIAYIAAHPNAH